MTPRVLIVASKYLPEYTGAAHRIHMLYKNLVDAAQPSVLCGGIERRAAETYEQEGVAVTRLKDRSSSAPGGRLARAFSFYRDFFAAWRALSARSFDVLHIVGTNAVTSAAYYYGLWHKIPMIVEMVTSGASTRLPLPGLSRLIVWPPHRRTVYVAISPPLADTCRREKRAAYCWSRPNPVDDKTFFPRPAAEKSALRARLTPFSDSDIVGLAVAKFMPQKNQIFLLDMLAMLPDRFKLVLAGPAVTDGPLGARDAAYMNQIRQTIRALNLTARVHIVPEFVTNPAEYMNAGDVYFMPNYREGLGTPMLEAMACGLPVIANADEPAFRPFIQTGVNGYVCPMEAPFGASAFEKAAVLPREKVTLPSAARAAAIEATYRRLLAGLTSPRFSLSDILDAAEKAGSA
jgi:glycosyltransferase involved in cell wall biosynthesis